MEYESAVKVDSKAKVGVRFEIARMSFGRRLELIRRVRELAQKYEFLEAGSSLKEKIEATAVAAEIDKIYLSWGLQGIEGLSVNGAPATPDSLIAKGPEDLCQEIIAAIKRECGLSEAERKN
jgi:hypothetical protein